MDLAIKHCDEAIEIEQWNKLAIRIKIQCLLEQQKIIDALEQIRIARPITGDGEIYQDFLADYKNKNPMVSFIIYLINVFLFIHNEYLNAPFLQIIKWNLKFKKRKFILINLQ